MYTRRRGRRLLGVFCLAWGFAFLSCVARFPEEDGRVHEIQVLAAPPEVRVALARDAEAVEVGSLGEFRVETLPGVVLTRGESCPAARLRAAGGRIVWGTSTLPARQVRIVPKDPWAGELTVAGNTYRGSLLVAVSGVDRVTLVNHLDLETYLEGVLGSEVPLNWPLEAVKAQAIAARTYALWRVRSTPAASLYDLTADTESQMYEGLRRNLGASERIRLRSAAGGTRGMMLTFARRIFQANFHAVCGGHTDPAWLLVGGDPVTPLMGVPCEYCAKAAARNPKVAVRYRWSFSIPERELRQKLSKLRGWDVPGHCGIREVRAAPVGPGGHAGVAEIVTDARSVRISTRDLREAVGWGLFLSPAFTARRKNDTFIFEGKGWGHGGGMCQWGAYAMAEEGFSASEILLYYYPGSDIERFY